jgi:hypothetical protein
MESNDREIYAFYREFTEDRLRRGLTLKGIAHTDRKPLFEELEFDMNTWRFVDYPSLQNVSICGNKIILTPWQYDRVSYLITSQQVADNFREYFYWMWNNHRFFHRAFNPADVTRPQKLSKRKVQKER